tara:strand:+ start:229 stop:492 length:264 start_codon:yes stop_codon:yes gene_type:complete
MRTAGQRARDSIMAMYRSQLIKFKRLSVYDDDGNFLFGKTTEFGTKVTESLIKITQKRLNELVDMNLNKRGVKFIEDYTNDKTDEEV